jgi:hypothetical protein
MQINKKESIFIIYFLPLFILKILDITSENWVLKGVGASCTLIFFICTIRTKYNIKVFRFFTFLLFYFMILIFTTGKQGIFFSVLMLLGMNGIHNERRIYKICLTFGAFFFIIACLINSNGSETMRYINGEWVSMIKRSNLLFVSFTAILCLYLFLYKNHLTPKKIVFLFTISFLIYLYVGSRTGLLAIYFLLISIILLQKKYISNKLIVKYTCFLFPLLCLLFCIYSGWQYNNSPFLNILDMALQGRIYQNNAYLERYDITLLGQPIYENTSADNYWVLDCAHLDMLICSGLLFTILWTILNICTIRFFYKRNDMVEVSVLMMYALYGITETFLPNCFLNMSFFLFARYLYSILSKKTYSSISSYEQQRNY